MKKLPICKGFDRSKPIGHVVLDDEYTRRFDYVLAIGGRMGTFEDGKEIGAEVMEFGLVTDSSYLAYLRRDDRTKERPNRPQWIDIQKLAKTEPIVASHNKAFELGHITREEALIGMVTLLSFKSNQLQAQVQVDFLKKMPRFKKIFTDETVLKCFPRPALPTVDPEKNKNGFYDDEQAVMDKLMEAYVAFIKLEREHPDELREFVDGVHLCQNVLGMRVLRRSVPTGWPTYQCEKKDDTNADSSRAENAGGPANA